MSIRGFGWHTAAAAIFVCMVWCGCGRLATPAGPRGQEWRPPGAPEQVGVHDFIDLAAYSRSAGIPRGRVTIRPLSRHALLWRPGRECP